MPKLKQLENGVEIIFEEPEAVGRIVLKYNAYGLSVHIPDILEDDRPVMHIDLAHNAYPPMPQVFDEIAEWHPEAAKVMVLLESPNEDSPMGFVMFYPDAHYVDIEHQGEWEEVLGKTRAIYRYPQQGE